MTKSKPTVASLTIEVAELKNSVTRTENSVAEILALFTEPTKATPKAAAPKAKKPKANKGNGNKWFADYGEGQGLELMKNNSGTGKEKSASWNQLKEAKVHLMLKKPDGSEKHWNSPS